MPTKHLAHLPKSPLLFCPPSTFAQIVCHLPSLLLSSSSSSAQHTVIEGQTHHGLLVAAVFPLDLSGLHAPQTSQVVWGGYWMEASIRTWYSPQCVFTLKSLNLSLLLSKRLKSLNLRPTLTLANAATVCCFLFCQNQIFKIIRNL